MRTYRSVSKFNTIRELRISGNIEGLIDIVQQMSKQTNQRFYRLEKKNMAKSSYGYQRAQDETGRKKPRYTESKAKLSKMDAEDLYRLAIDLNAKIASDTTTVTGLRDIENKRLFNRTQSLEARGLSLSESELKEFLDAGGSDFLNNKFLDSTQVIDDFIEATKSGNMTVEQFINEYTKGQKRIIKSGSAPFDYGKAHRNLLKAQKRNEKGKSK